MHIIYISNSFTHARSGKITSSTTPLSSLKNLPFPLLEKLPQAVMVGERVLNCFWLWSSETSSQEDKLLWGLEAADKSEASPKFKPSMEHISSESTSLLYFTTPWWWLVSNLEGEEGEGGDNGGEKWDMPNKVEVGERVEEEQWQTKQQLLVLLLLLWGLILVHFFLLLFSLECKTLSWRGVWAKKQTFRLQFLPSLQASVLYLEGCNQHSNTPWENSHASPRSHWPRRNSGQTVAE